MNFSLRSSIDTLYIGLQIFPERLKDELEKIKNNLFFGKSLVISDKSRNRFYQSEMCSPDKGFFCFFFPRKNLANDFMTIQLTGRFFYDVKSSKKFLDFLFDDYSGMINFQRVDVALDVLWKKFPKDCDYTKNLGFPTPSYSPLWKNRKVDFCISSRLKNDNHFVNMFTNGKDDLRLRVYDKSLEILESKRVVKDYSSLYGLTEKNILKVFRIEYQMRSDKLKTFVDSCVDVGCPFDSYEAVVFNVLAYIFTKYDFKYIPKDMFLDSFKRSCNKKTQSTLENRYLYARKMAFSYSKKMEDLYSELLFKQEEERQIFNLYKNNKAIDDCLPNLDYYKLVEEMDLMNYLNNENIPF